MKEKVLEYLKDGKSIALVTDRGTPIISDPGYKTVKYVTDKGFNVVSLPGATAFVPALTVSGLAPQPFLFYGFLNSKESKRSEELEKLSQENIENIKNWSWDVITKRMKKFFDKALKEGCHEKDV